MISHADDHPWHALVAVQGNFQAVGQSVRFDLELGRFGIGLLGNRQGREQGDEDCGYIFHGFRNLVGES